MSLIPERTTGVAKVYPKDPKEIKVRNTGGKNERKGVFRWCLKESFHVKQNPEICSETSGSLPRRVPKRMIYPGRRAIPTVSCHISSALAGLQHWPQVTSAQSLARG